LFVFHRRCTAWMRSRLTIVERLVAVAPRLSVNNNE
jgi:hypothetical protein